MAKTAPSHCWLTSVDRTRSVSWDSVNASLHCTLCVRTQDFVRLKVGFVGDSLVASYWGISNHSVDSCNCKHGYCIQGNFFPCFMFTPFAFISGQVQDWAIKIVSNGYSFTCNTTEFKTGQNHLQVKKSEEKKNGGYR